MMSRLENFHNNTYFVGRVQGFRKPEDGEVFFPVGACLVCHNATICDKLPYTELQIREGIEDNLRIIFLIVTPH